MDGAYDIPDSTDWLKTPLQDFSILENALHCQICKEFFETPMLTSCSHTFCSKCIRTSLSTDGRCPACRTADQANKLRNNWALQEVVSAFLQARPAALEVATKAHEDASALRRPGKRKRNGMSARDEALEQQDGRTTRSKSRRVAASQTSHQDATEIDDSDTNSDFKPEAEHEDDGLIECPLGCGKRMAIEAVEPHLDRCEEEKMQASRTKARTPTNTFRPLKSGAIQNDSKPQDRISELHYSSLTDAKLKKKLDELGIPAWGGKPLMIKRHTEWVNIWNANCDSNQPRPKRDLLRELESWERTQGGRAAGPNALSSNIMRKDFDGAGWVDKNRDDFSRLISEARKKQSSPAVDAEDKSNVGIDKAATNGEKTSLETSDADMFHNGPDQALDVSQANLDPDDASTSGTGVPKPVESLQEQLHVRTTPSLVSDSERTQGPSNHVDATSHLAETGMNGDHNIVDSLGLHLQSGATRKVPMFAVPQQPVTDLDIGGAETTGH